MWGTISSGAQLVLGTLFGIFLARILSPSDYGMVGLLTVFSQIASILQDSGFRTALANRRQIVHEDYNAVFWFNVATGCAMYLLLFFLAPLITEFYQQSDAAAHQDLSELTPLARFSFLGFVMASLGTAHYAYLFRTLQVLGAYGFRGYFERKKHFLDSIAPAIRNLREWLSEGECPYPYLYDVLSRMVELPAFQTEVPAQPDEPCGKDAGMERVADRLRADIGLASLSRYDGRGLLVVRVFSFSYKKGIPEDTSGNGGGYVFDCRSTHNPGRYEPYKSLTGLDEPVIRFLEEDGEILMFLDSLQIGRCPCGALSPARFY